MCGAYALHHSGLDIAARFQAEPVNGLFEPRYKVAPSEGIAIVRLDQSGCRRIEAARWGLIPFWAKDPAIGRKMVNARAETLSSKPAFRTSFAKKRCLIPADGFYEWDHATRQPMYFRRADSELFAFAGLWDEWTDHEGATLQSCTLVTTEADETVSRVHDRMPAILLPDAETIWLGEGASSAGARSVGSSPVDLMDLLRPFPDDLLASYWVSRSVSGRGRHGPESIAPTPMAPAQATLPL